jgi:hypothetical protein
MAGPPGARAGPKTGRAGGATTLADPASQRTTAARNSPSNADRQAVADARRQRLVERLVALGPRVVLELLLELAERRGLAHLDQRLERYAALDPALLRAVGGDRMPPRVLRMVPS